MTYMYSSPSKRRKTSPTTLTKVSDQNTQLRPNFQDGERDQSRRASFMSPTKASLARFNPGLLPPTKPSPPQRRGSSGSQGAYSRGLSAKRVNNGEAVMRAKSSEPSARATGMTSTLGVKTNGQGLFATPRRRSRTPEGETKPSKKAKLAPIEDIRASPPEEAREEHNVVQDTPSIGGEDVGSNGYNGQSHKMDLLGPMPATEQPQLPYTPSHLGLPGPLVGMDQQEDREPSLPSTPIQLGLEMPPEPPKGLLFSSPSRRSKRKGNARAKSSPLKPQPGQASLRPDSSHSTLGPRVYIINTPKPLPTTQQAHLLSMRARLAGLEKQLQVIEHGLLRKLLVSGWEDDDDKGAKEISKRERETTAGSTRVIRLREELRQFELANATALDLTGGQLPNLEVSDRLRNEHAATNRSFAPPKVVPLSQRLAQFLPFSSNPPPPTPKPPSPQDLGPSQTLNLEPLGDGVVSLTVTISESILLPSTPENDLLQSQIIVLSSSSQALLLKLHLTVNVVSQFVTQIQVIELSDWAEGELGRWLRAPSQDRSVAAIGTALGHYWKVCLQRLKCWRDAARDYGVYMIADDGAFGKIPLRPTNADLAYIIPRLCWQDLHIARGTLFLTIQWRVSISKEGNVDSDVSALAVFPETWRRTEDGAELDNIGQAFKMLVIDRGAAQAICVIAGLLFPS